VCEEGGFLYDCDSYADELPYWNHEHGHPHLIIPYTLSENDMRFASPNGFSHGEEFFIYLRDHLDYLIKEARETDGVGRMMSVGLHCRLVGRAGRAAGLEKFMEHVEKYGEEVWVCRRDEIAKHWYENHWNDEWGRAPTVPIHNRLGLQSKL
jgi:allantoinase